MELEFLFGVFEIVLFYVEIEGILFRIMFFIVLILG